VRCAVYDTYVTKKDKQLMHFDVIVEADTPHEKAIEYGKEYLERVGEKGQKMTQDLVSIISRSGRSFYTFLFLAE
jgi:hypothetical protein